MGSKCAHRTVVIVNQPTACPFITVDIHGPKQLRLQAWQRLDDGTYECTYVEEE